MGLKRKQLTLLPMSTVDLAPPSPADRWRNSPWTRYMR
jgi:hypothetical protein